MKVFADDELNEIHMATLNVLKNFGVKVYYDAALDNEKDNQQKIM